jgi:hypothetical protein
MNFLSNLLAKKSILDLEDEKASREKFIDELRDENLEKIKKLTEENEIKLNVRDQELQSAKDRENDLLKRIQQLSITEDELREKVKST